VTGPLPMRIVGTGVFHPPTVVASADLAKRVGRSAAWIERSSGVIRRRRWDDDPAIMAAHAAREALGPGGPPDLIVNASLTPRQLLPDTSVFVARELGLEGVPSFSVHATCLSFMVALRTAASFVSGGAYRRVLITSSERSSPSLNLDQPESAVLFGDGAAAAVIEPVPAAVGASRRDEGSALLAWRMETFPEGADLTTIPGAGVLRHPNDPSTQAVDALFSMDGRGVYRMARKRVRAVLDEAFREAGLTKEDVALVVPHQTSRHGLASLHRTYGFARDTVVDILAEYGNCVAASIPMALHHGLTSRDVRRGDVVLLVGTGAGLSIAATLLRY